MCDHLRGKPTHLMRIGILDFHSVKHRFHTGNQRRIEDRRVDRPSAAVRQFSPLLVGQIGRVLDCVPRVLAGIIPVQLDPTHNTRPDRQVVLLRRYLQHRLGQASDAKHPRDCPPDFLKPHLNLFCIAHKRTDDAPVSGLVTKKTFRRTSTQNFNLDSTPR